MWPCKMAWAFMSTDSSKFVWDCVEVNMTISREELTNEENNCSQGDQQGARYCSNYLHCLRFQPRFSRKALTALAAFRKFMDFCRHVCATKIFLKWNSEEGDRLRSWFKLADPTFEVPLYASTDWRYTAPKWRTEAFLRPYVKAVQDVLPLHQHISLKEGPKNHHCAAVEVLYYITHFKFKAETQNFAKKRPYPVYKNTGQVTEREKEALRRDDLD